VWYVLRIVTIAPNHAHKNVIIAPKTAPHNFKLNKIESEENAMISLLPAHIKELAFKSLDNYDCGICLEIMKLDTTLATSCGHFFCTPCIKKWCTQKDTCPVCIATISKPRNRYNHL
jgi:hypothetical protein